MALSWAEAMARASAAGGDLLGDDALVSPRCLHPRAGVFLELCGLAVWERCSCCRANRLQGFGCGGKKGNVSGMAQARGIQEYIPPTPTFLGFVPLGSLYRP